MTVRMPTDNAELLAEKKRLEQAAAAELQGDVLAVLATPEGRRVWLWVEDYLCNPLAWSADPDARARADGRREVAAIMRQALVPHPDLRVALTRERLLRDEKEATFRLMVHRLDREAAEKKQSGTNPRGERSST